jgi:hypothetical protein
MKRALLLLLACCSPLFGQSLEDRYSSAGQLIYTPFETAPFPHPLRAAGHQHNDKFFSAAEHYSDSRVALFIPKGFKPDGKTDFVIHFHGWGNNVSNAIPKYKLIDQFVASDRNAILVLPEAAVDAQDSFGGKLEDPDGFKKFMAEVVDKLRERKVIKSDKVGKIILSGHSGGYEVISEMLARGGMSEHVHEVWLFDALYANTEWFALWFDHHKGRFIDLYTDHGGTKENALDLMTALKENGVPFYTGDDAAVTPKELRDNHLVFLYSALPHDQTMQDHRTFQKFLETSDLGKLRH